MKDDRNIEHLVEAYKIIPTKAFPAVPEYIHHFMNVKLVLMRESKPDTEEYEHNLKYMNILFNKIMVPRYGHIDTFLEYYTQRFEEAMDFQNKKKWGCFN